MAFPWKLLRSDLKDFKAYSSARHLAQEGSVFLDANENPYDPSGGEIWNRYPDPQPKALIEELVKLYGVTDTEILVSRGSDEAIDLLIRSFCSAGKDKIIICPPTYGVYQFYANLQGAETISVPLRSNSFQLDTASILAALREEVKIVFVCSPNNPTGNLVNFDDLEPLLAATVDKALVVVDEAYIEFSSAKSATELIQKYPQLVVLKTLSKAWGLAGLRCGSLIATAELITFFKKVIAPYPIPRTVVKEVLGVLKQGPPSSLNLLIEEREKLAAALCEFGSVEKVYPSAANFILCRFKEAGSLFNALKSAGIILRSRAEEPLTKNCLRISIGTPEENEQLLQKIREWEKSNGY